MSKKSLIRIVLSFVGVILIGSAIGLSRLADLGTDPYTTFNLGLSALFNLSFGHLIIISNFIGLALVVLMAKHLIGLGTIFNILLVGYVSDLVVNTVQANMTLPTSLFVRVVVTGIGLVVLAIGAALYIVADKGVAPYDAYPIIIEEKASGKVSFRMARVLSDIVCIAIGFFLGATVGIATVVAGFFMGPMIQFFRTKFEQMLEKAE